METIILLIGAAAVSGITELSKRFGIRMEYALLVASIFVGSAYYITQTYLPQGTYEQMAQAVLSIGATAALLYDFLVKQSKKNGTL